MGNPKQEPAIGSPNSQHLSRLCYTHPRCRNKCTCLLDTRDRRRQTGRYSTPFRTALPWDIIATSWVRIWPKHTICGVEDMSKNVFSRLLILYCSWFYYFRFTSCVLLLPGRVWQLFADLFSDGRPSRPVPSPHKNLGLGCMWQTRLQMGNGRRG